MSSGSMLMFHSSHSLDDNPCSFIQRHFNLGHFNPLQVFFIQWLMNRIHQSISRIMLIKNSIQIIHSISIHLSTKFKIQYEAWESSLQKKNTKKWKCWLWSTVDFLVKFEQSQPNPKKKNLKSQIPNTKLLS